MVQSLLHNVKKSPFPDESALKPPKTAELQAVDVQKGVVIGRGGMATVYSRGRWQGKNVAVKECALANRRHTNAAQNFMETEASIHVLLLHRNIVRILGFYYEGITFNIVIEIMEVSVESLFAIPN